MDCLNEIIINGVKYKPESALTGNYVIVRSRDAGVFAGYLKEKTDTRIVLNQSRRIWYWEGAATLSQLALEGVKGVKAVKNCKFPVEIPEHEIAGWCECIPATEAARLSIASVPVWSA